MLDNCKLCNLINNIKVCNKPEDTILYEDSNFIITPTLGSIIEGYLMLITKKHINSMAELSSEHITDLLNLIDKIKGVLYRTYNVISIVFEHGSGNTMWNWKQYPFLGNVNLTVEKLKNLDI